MKEVNKILKSICPRCGQPNQVIWVHRHGQCSVCRYNIDEWCKGETREQQLEKNLAKEEME